MQSGLFNLFFYLIQIIEKSYTNHREIIEKSQRIPEKSQRITEESQRNHRESQTNHRGITVVSQYYLIGFTENYRSQEEKNDEL